MIHQSVSINGIDMLSTYRMALANRHCVQPPVPKTIYQDVPGPTAPWTSPQRLRAGLYMNGG